MEPPLEISQPKVHIKPWTEPQRTPGPQTQTDRTESIRFLPIGNISLPWPCQPFWSFSHTLTRSHAHPFELCYWLFLALLRLPSKKKKKLSFSPREPVSWSKLLLSLDRFISSELSLTTGFPFNILGDPSQIGLLESLFFYSFSSLSSFLLSIYCKWITDISARILPYKRTITHQPTYKRSNTSIIKRNQLFWKRRIRNRINNINNLDQSPNLSPLGHCLILYITLPHLTFTHFPLAFQWSTIHPHPHSSPLIYLSWYLDPLFVWPTRLLLSSFDHPTGAIVSLHLQPCPCVCALCLSSWQSAYESSWESSFWASKLD